MMQLEFLRHAIRLALEKMLAGEGGPFGAIVVQDGRIVGQGWNSVTSSLDPTAHAEIMAIRAACQKLGQFSLPNCELYTSCEPCPMCLAASYWARLQCIHYAANRQDAADAGFDDQHFYAELALPEGERKIPLRSALRDESLAPFEAWRRKSDRVPY